MKTERDIAIIKKIVKILSVPIEILEYTAKSIADRIDWGAILLQADEDDVAALESILRRGNYPKPNVKMSVYKNRRGKYKDILLWMNANRGTCRFEAMFATDYQYRLIPMEDLQIKVSKEEFNISVF